MTVDDIRKIALALPETTEEPHFKYDSYRVHGKIFATLPPDGAHLHVFVDDERRELALAMFPEIYEKLWWGKKPVGLKVALQHADRDDVRDLLRSAWAYKAPKRLAGTS